MCIQREVGPSGLYYAQQVSVKAHACRRFTGVCMGEDDDGYVHVKKHAGGEVVAVDAADVSPMPLRPGLAPGASVMRARLDGEEELATVVSVVSSEEVSIRVHNTHAVYTSKAFRLRVVGLAQPFTVPPAKKKTAVALSLAALLASVPGAPRPAYCTMGESWIKEVVAAKYPTLREVIVNPHAVEDGPLHTAFEKTVRAAGPDYIVDIFVHGTSDSNTYSIFATSLRTNVSCWFTRCTMTAAQYARSRGPPSGDRVIVFLVLHPQSLSCEKIVTTSSPGWHLPLAAARV